MGTRRMKFEMWAVELHGVVASLAMRKCQVGSIPTRSTKFTAVR